VFGGVGKLNRSLILFAGIEKESKSPKELSSKHLKGRKGGRGGLFSNAGEH